MWTIWKHNINIFHNAPKTGPGQTPEEQRKKVAESHEIVDRTKLDALTKEMLEGFLKEPDRQKAMNFLMKYIQQKEKELQNNPTLLKALKDKEGKLGVFSNFDGYIFGGSPVGNQKEIPEDRQKSIKNLLQITNVTIDFSRIKRISKFTDLEVQKFVDTHKIGDYTSYWIQTCLNHPQQIKSGLGGKISRGTEMFIGRATVKPLRKELEDLKKLGTQLPNEYLAVIETLIKITDTDRFKKYTGSINESYHDKEEVLRLREDFNTFVNMAAKQGRVFTKEDFNRFFDEKRELTSKEKEENDKFSKESLLKINALGTKGEKLAIIDKIISEESVVGRHSKKQQNDRLSYLHNIRSETERGKNEDLKGLVGQTLRDIESSNKHEDVEKEAERLRQTTRSPHFVDYDTAQKKYVIISAADLARELLKPNLGNIDRKLFQSLLKAPGWETFIKNAIGTEGIAAVGLYLKNRPNTLLFTDIEGAKGFFIEGYQKTVTHQNSILKEKNIQGVSGDIISSFPRTFEHIPLHLRNNPQLQNALKKANMAQFYELLSENNVSTETIKTIMNEVTQEAHNLRIQNQREALKESINWKGKTFSDARSEFTFIDGDKSVQETLFKEIHEKSIAIGSISAEKVEDIMKVLPESSSLYKYLRKLVDTKNAGKIEGGAKRVTQIVRNAPNDKAPPALSEEQKQSIKLSESLGRNLAEHNLNTQLAKQNIRPGNLKEEQERKKQLEEEQKKMATIVAGIAKDPTTTQEDRRELIRSISDEQLSDQQIDKWINTQVFLSKYVEEKNFVDMVEKNAAYMNLGETKSVGELYERGKLDIANMSEESGSVKLGETSIMGHNSFAGMNALMNCRVEIGDGGVFSRTISTPDGKIIARNIPLENISTTIEQLGRFYTIGLGPLVPKMEKVNTYISKVRPDAIGGTDGTYGIAEDEKFLKIMIIMIYGEEKLPGEKNIPNLIRVFNQPGRENEPSYILKQKGILTETGEINDISLERELKTASAKI